MESAILGLNRRFASGAALVLVGLAVVGCGSSGSSTTTTSSPAAPATSTPATSTPAGSSGSGSSGIPQGANAGDRDSDNNGGPSDGDGNQ